jgi:hypothetical protein
VTQQEQVVDVARSKIGDSYGWGAEGPTVFDCSGLTQWAYAQIGIAIPRTSQAQAAGGVPVAYSDLQPGDLIIYYPDASHVALYSGSGNVIEASTYGVPIEEVPVNDAGPYNTARRYLTGEAVTQPVYTLFADVSEFQTAVNDSYPYPVLSIRSNDGTYEDHNFTQNYQWCVNACNAGTLECFIVYFYWRPGATGSNTHMQMVNAAGGPHPKMVTMIDLESGGNPDVDQTTDLDGEYQTLAAWLGNEQRVIAYANLGDEKTMWQFKPAHLEWILAGYGANPDDPTLIKLAHQYTDGTGYGAASGLPDGCPPFGTCDMNSADGYTPQTFATACGIDTGGTVTQPDPTLAQILAVVQDIQVQLRGPNLQGWPQLGTNSAGENLTVVDALAAQENSVANILTFIASEKPNS